ncbi:hypothetical protein OSB04_018456 [Centaurea solstitialis]|uniref:Ubiquitin-like protease family profile domain-containing protein n=1 Tax=Centaurea solstitialis TaxID=347529 RepID=A0AA38TFU0_9ASTR|nr:hypothetical protein OSB04_018456 [Centaurea solstitialis]
MESSSLQRRSSSPPISSAIDDVMEEEEEEEELNTFKKKKNTPFDIDWNKLMDDDDVDDRPPEIVITSAVKSNGGGDGGGESEYRRKTDGELEEMISRTKHNIVTLSDKLIDKGEKLKATLRRCEDEVERRKKKGDTRCEDSIQLSDQSDDGEIPMPSSKLSRSASRWRKKSDQKSSTPSKFAKLFCTKLKEDREPSRTVNAFEEDLSFINPRHGRKTKQNFQLTVPGRRSRLQLPSREKQFRCPTSRVVDSERGKISNGDKKVSQSVIRDKPAFFPKYERTHAFEDQPSARLRLRPLSTYRLVDEEEEEPEHAEKLDDCMKDVKVCYPSRDDQDSVEVTYKDMACLAPEACLSSAIMNFYIRYLHQLTSSENKRSNHHFFNTYFYNKLQKLSYREDSFLKFRKWWKCVNIFEKAYILLPIHEKAHWSLGIICLPTKEDELGPIVLHLDSLGLHDSSSIFDNIRRFVKEEWNYLRSSQDRSDLPIADEIWEDLEYRIEDRRIPVPQQRNTYDCGLFVLFYIERFIKEAPERMTKEHLSMFNKQWFHPNEASNLRVRIHNLLVQEFKIAKDKEDTKC